MLALSSKLSTSPYRHAWRPQSQLLQGTQNECKSALSSVKGSLKAHSQWRHEHINNVYIPDINDNGYKLPFLSVPKAEKLNDNKSACDNPEFVTAEICKLVEAGILLQVSESPTVINALMVAENSVGKQRLVLDLRGVNPLLHVPKFRFEDVTVA